MGPARNTGQWFDPKKDLECGHVTGKLTLCSYRENAPASSTFFLLFVTRFWIFKGNPHWLGPVLAGFLLLITTWYFFVPYLL